MISMIDDSDDLFDTQDGEATDEESSKEKATLDVSKIKEEEEQSRAQQKVELDLEDAPFLEDDEEDESLFSEAPAEETPLFDAEEDKKKTLTDWLRSKWAFAFLLIILLFILIYPMKLMLFDSDKASIPLVEDPQDFETHAPQEAPEPEEYTITMDPFWIEKKDADGQVRFVHFQFSFTTLSPALEGEIKQKKFILRDAVYYYLRNKNFTFLDDTSNLETLKEDLVTVINQYIGNDQLDTILVEKYLVK